MADRYAQLRAALGDFDSGSLDGREWINLVGPDTIRALLTDYDRMRGALVAVVHQLDGRRVSKSGDDAPGHSHQVSGIWNSDNGDLAGKPCAWCALWREAKALAQEQGGSDDGDPA